MSRFARLATGLRDLGNDINANINKALNIPKASDSPNQALLEEARAGRVQGLEAILEELSHIVDVNGALDRSFFSPLCLACAGGHEDAALFLLRKAAADPNNAAGAEAAASAQRQSRDPYAHDEFVGSGVTTADRAGGAGGAGIDAPPAPLALAVEGGLRHVVDELLAMGARADARRAGDGWTAMHMCASRGDAFIMRALLGAPLADPGVRTNRLETPLSIACSRGHLSIVDMLLGGQAAEGSAQGVKGAGDDSGGTACTSGSGGGGALPGSRRHAEERTWAGRTPIHRAAAVGCTEIVLRLLAHGVDADPADAHGATPLILSCYGGHFGAAKALVRTGGASIRTSTDEGDTALHAAAGAGAQQRGTVRVVKLLLQAGAEVDALNLVGSTALHLAAAAGVAEFVTALLLAGANPSITNSCGLTPGSCFLRPSGPVAPAPGWGAATGVIEPATQEVRGLIRRTLRDYRGRHGHLRRLADANAKRVAVAGMANQATCSVNRFVEFALKTQRWDLDAREHRSRLRKLERFRVDVLSDPNLAAGTTTTTTATVTPPTGGDSGNGSSDCDGASRGRPPEPEASAPRSAPLLLDLSPEREGRAALAVKRRRKAAAEAIRGAKVALQDLGDWKGSVLAERLEVTKFLRDVDPVLAFGVGLSCNGDDTERHGDTKETVHWWEADVVVADPSYLAADASIEESHGGRGASPAHRLGRHASWAAAGAFTATAGSTTPSTSPGSTRGSGARPVGFMLALAALDPCVGALRKATSTTRSGDHLSTALVTLREHVKATLIDLMDLETSIPGDAVDEDDDVEDDDDGGGGGDGSDGSNSFAGVTSEATLALTSAEAGALDVKVAGLLRRLMGGGAGGDRKGVEHGCDGGAKVNTYPPSLAHVYGEGLGGAAWASEVEVDVAESLTARALCMVVGAAAGPLLWALDDAYQRLTKAEMELRQLVPEAEALLGTSGGGSVEELAREARSRLVTVRQQAVDEEDLLDELLSKLRRRRRQAAGEEEIGSIEDERSHVRARLAAFRSVKLAELKDLRRSGAYRRFPELILEHPNPAENAFRQLLLSGIAVRDPDEWEENHMDSLKSMASGVRSGSSGERVLDGLGGEGCRLAEVDGLAVAIVEVDCGDREAERNLVATLLRSSPLLSGPNGTRLSLPPRDHPPPELVTITGISLRKKKAMIEVPVEGALTAEAWVTAAPTPVMSGGGIDRSALPGLTEGLEPTGAAAARVLRMSGGDEANGERREWEVWAVMVQALRGLVSVHALSESSTHGAVCLANILVAARLAPKPSAASATAAAADGSPKQEVPTEAEKTAGRLYSSTAQASSLSPTPMPPGGLRRAQLGPCVPAALARPPMEALAPEVVRGQALRQPADMYAFGVALRSACCEGSAGMKDCEAGDGGGKTGGQTVLPHGRGPPAGLLRQSLVQVLESMLEEDPSRRCTAVQALDSDYFRVPPPRLPTPVFPSNWLPRVRRASKDSSGGKPNWVVAALAAHRDGGVSLPQGWWESCYAVDVALSGGNGKGEGGAAAEQECAEIEAFLQCSLPGARLHRLVRLQDRGRWLRFACERDAAISAAAAAAAAAATAPTGTNVAPVAANAKASVSRLFADPREVIAREPLGVILATTPGEPAIGADRNGGQTVAGTLVQEEGVGDDGRSGGRSSLSAAEGWVRCSKTARFAAVAFAPPPAATAADEGEWAGNNNINNMRTLAIVRAVTGSPSEVVASGTGCTADWQTLSSSEHAGAAAAAGAAGLMPATSSLAQNHEDPFCGMAPSIDDLTRVAGIGICSSFSSAAAATAAAGLENGTAAVDGASSGIGNLRDVLPSRAGLAAPAAHSIKTWESLGEREAGRGQDGGRRRGVRGGDGTAAVHTLRRDACYPEYLATFSFPPHSTG